MLQKNQIRLPSLQRKRNSLGMFGNYKTTKNKKRQSVEPKEYNIINNIEILQEEKEARRKAKERDLENLPIYNQDRDYTIEKPFATSSLCEQFKDNKRYNKKDKNSSKPPLPGKCTVDIIENLKSKKNEIQEEYSKFQQRYHHNFHNNIFNTKDQFASTSGNQYKAPSDEMKDEIINKNKQLREQLHSIMAIGHTDLRQLDPKNFRTGKGSLSNAQPGEINKGISGCYIKEDLKQIRKQDNDLLNLGTEQKLQWSGKKNYSRYRRDNSGLRKTSMDLIDSNVDKETEDQSQFTNRTSYMESLNRLGNNHISSFIAKKNRARETILNSGANNLDRQQLSKNSPSMRKPTSLSIFPHIGMISNKNTYTTHNSIDQKQIQMNPKGCDEYTDKRYNNNIKHHIKEHQNTLIENKQLLIDRSNVLYAK